MNKIIIALILVLMCSNLTYADWSKTTTTVSDDDTFIVSDNSEATGSKTKYIAVEDLAAEVLDRADEPTIQADDPTVSSENGIYFATTSQKMFVKDDEFLWASGAGVYTAITSGYDLTLTMSGVSGLDKVTIGGTDYTTTSTITGLSGVVPITASYGDSDTLDVTGVTGSYPSYSITMDSAESADFAFSTASSYLVDEDFSGTTIPTGFVEIYTPDYSVIGAVSFDYNDILVTDAFATPADTVYVAGVFNLSALANTSDTVLVGLMETSDDTLSTIPVVKYTIRSTDVTRIYNGASVTGSITYSVGVDYYFWLKYNTIGEMSVRVGTDGTYANSVEHVSTMVGTETTSISAVRIGQFTNDTHGINTFSRLIVSETEIGDIN